MSTFMTCGMFDNYAAVMLGFNAYNRASIVTSELRPSQNKDHILAILKLNFQFSAVGLMIVQCLILFLRTNCMFSLTFRVGSSWSWSLYMKSMPNPISSAHCISMSTRAWSQSSFPERPVVKGWGEGGGVIKLTTQATQFKFIRNNWPT